MTWPGRPEPSHVGEKEKSVHCRVHPPSRHVVVTHIERLNGKNVSLVFPVFLPSSGCSHFHGKCCKFEGREDEFFRPGRAMGRLPPHFDSPIMPCPPGVIGTPVRKSSRMGMVRFEHRLPSMT